MAHELTIFKAVAKGLKDELTQLLPGHTVRYRSRNHVTGAEAHRVVISDEKRAVRCIVTPEPDGIKVATHPDWGGTLRVQKTIPYETPNSVELLLAYIKRNTLTPPPARQGPIQQPVGRISPT